MSPPVLAENPQCNPICRVCHYRNLDYPAQLARKKRWAETQLGRWQEVLREIIPAPESEQLAYRSKSWLRSFYQDGEVSFGMYRAIKIDGRWEKEFVSWDTCPLHIEAIRHIIERLKPLLAEKAPHFAEKSLVGIWVGSPHLVLISRNPDVDADLETFRSVDWAQVLAPPFDRTWFHFNPQVGRNIFGHREILPLNGPGIEGTHPIRAFRQVAQSLLIQAREIALKHLLRSRPELVLDLYCGTGDLSLALGSEVGWLGIELSSEAVKYANTLRPQPEAGGAPHAAFVGTVEHRLRDPRVMRLIEGRLSVYINPPRSGLSEEAQERVLAVVVEKAPETIAYLSCSASSLGRDLKAFQDAGYRIELLQPYDFFPQTEHFETLALLTRII
jgi:23S rRNA (uracil1939-C5)-methyltransferase